MNNVTNDKNYILISVITSRPWPGQALGGVIGGSGGGYAGSPLTRGCQSGGGVCGGSSGTQVRTSGTDPV